MSDPSEPHPLDQDWDDEAPETRPRLKTNAYKPLLRASVMLAIGCAIVIVLSTIGTLSATPNSLFENITATIHLIARWTLLLACCGILISFRITTNKSPPTSKNPLKLNVGSWHASGLLTLFFFNGIGCGLIILFLNLFIFYLGFLGFAVPVLLLFFAGWLAIAAVWHTGYLRAYAIGTLTAMFLELNGGAGMMFASMLAGSRQSWMGNAYWLSGIAVCLPPVTGLLCACYVVVLERYRRDISYSITEPRESLPIYDLIQRSEPLNAPRDG